MGGARAGAGHEICRRKKHGQFDRQADEQEQRVVPTVGSAVRTVTTAATTTTSSVLASNVKPALTLFHRAVRWAANHSLT